MSSSRATRRVHESSNRKKRRSTSIESSTERRDRPSKTITLAGAIAGGFIGRKLGHGDLLTTLTGIAVGALGTRGLAYFSN